MPRRSRSIGAAVGALISALLVSMLATVSTAPTPVAAGPSAQPFGFQSITPQRLLDTRETGDVFGPGEVQRLAVNLAGISGVSAVALSITITQPTTGSFLTAWPTGSAMPATATMNYVGGQTVTNTAIIGVGGDGTISLYNLTGEVHVVVDATGWFPAGSGFTGITPSRLMDTREAGGPIGENQIRTLTVVGGAVPPNAVAVALNVAATQPSANSFVTVWPAGGAIPETSSVNFFAGSTVGNGVIATVGAGGAVNILNRFGATHVVVDVTGYILADQGYIAVQPRRLVDSRAPAEYTGGLRGPLSRSFALTLRSTEDHRYDSTVPVPHGPGAVVLSVAVTQPSNSGFVTLWPSGSAAPLASNLTFAPGQTVASLVIVGTDDRGRFSLSLGGGVPLNAQVIVDLVGYFPNDGLGLLALNVNGRSAALGTDRIAVLVCEDPAFPVNRAEITATLARVTEYYRQLSGGIYVPVFDPPVYTALNNPVPLDTCAGTAYDWPWPRGVEAAFGIDGYARNTTGQLGFAGLPIGVPPWQVFPANGRSGVIALVGAQPIGAIVTKTGALVHELGHTLDFPHSGPNAYDNRMDVMSAPPFAGADWFNPQATIVLNRYRAGWIAPSQVAIHRAPGSTYRIGALGDPGTQMVVIPSSVPGKFIVLGTRVATGIDSALPGDGIGVEVYKVDARCTETYCTGLDDTIVPAIGGSFTRDHVLGVGEQLTLGGTSIQVIGSSGNAFDVRIDGAPIYDFAVLSSRAVVVDPAETTDPTRRQMPWFAGAGTKWATDPLSFVSATIEE